MRECNHEVGDLRRRNERPGDDCDVVASAAGLAPSDRGWRLSNYQRDIIKRYMAKRLYEQGNNGVPPEFFWYVDCGESYA
jgi:hypothetical protein